MRTKRDFWCNDGTRSQGHFELHFKQLCWIDLQLPHIKKLHSLQTHLGKILKERNVFSTHEIGDDGLFFWFDGGLCTLVINVCLLQYNTIQIKKTPLFVKKFILWHLFLSEDKGPLQEEISCFLEVNGVAVVMVQGTETASWHWLVVIVELKLVPFWKGKSEFLVEIEILWEVWWSVENFGILEGGSEGVFAFCFWLIVVFGLVFKTHGGFGILVGAAPTTHCLGGGFRECCTSVWRERFCDSERTQEISERIKSFDEKDWINVIKHHNRKYKSTYCWFGQGIVWLWLWLLTRRLKCVAILCVSLRKRWFLSFQEIDNSCLSFQRVNLSSLTIMFGRKWGLYLACKLTKRSHPWF